MYLIQCKPERGGIWTSYGGPYTSAAQARDVKERAEALHILTVRGAAIVYRITTV